MNRIILRILSGIVFLSIATSASAQWYNSYEEGVAAARAGNWQVVVQKMSEAIAKMPNENNRARTYGTQFINYHPYYYRGVAYLNTGKYEQAIDDLDRALGIGEENLGSIETLHRRAEDRIKAAQVAPPPVQVPPPRVVEPPVTPPPRTTTQPPISVPTTPGVDPQLEPARAQAQSAIAQADRKNNEARRANAPTAARNDYNSALRKLADAQQKLATARTVADMRAVSDLASEANGKFSAAITIAQGAAPPPLPTRAADDVLKAARTKIVKAIETYYSGDYNAASRQFREIAREVSKDPMVWAFLGASQYSEYYLDGDLKPELKEQAEESFRQAKKLRKSFELDGQYFSPRIQRFFKKVTG